MAQNPAAPGVTRFETRRLMLRPTQKMTVIDRIARELEERYSFREIDAYLEEFKIGTPHEFGDSKVNYVKTTLRGVETTTILAMAEDLEIAIPGASAAALRAPHNWPDDSKFRLFISHISDARDKATRLRDCLVPYYISGFVAPRHSPNCRMADRNRARAAYDGCVFGHPYQRLL
jgi:hypothetical protein